MTAGACPDSGFGEYTLTHPKSNSNFNFNLNMGSHTPLAAYLQQHPDTQYVDAMLCDVSCVMRGKRYPIGMADKLFTDGMMSPGSLFLLSVNGASLDPEGLGFSDGDPDQVAMPIADTLAPAPWAQHPTAQVMMSMQGLDRQPYYFEPRNVLTRVINRFSELNLRPVAAFELEFYLLDRAHRHGKCLQPPRAPLSRQRLTGTQVYSLDELEEFSDYLHAVLEACAQQGVASGAMSAEYAPGQFEINLCHSEQLLAAADQCVMFRRIVQCVAKQHQMQSTFMAKPYADHAGSGLHLHLSLLNADGENVFAGDGRFPEPTCASALLKYAIGGLQQSMPESMALFAPNINSYRRFAANNYVPMGPSWGFDNRSVAIRIPKSPPRARRFEYRVAGADANPYLTLAAVLAGLHHGISKRLEADAAATGNAGAAKHPAIPFDLPSAVDECRRGPILADYLGRQYLNAYCACKLKEYQQFIDRKPPQAGWYL